MNSQFNILTDVTGEEELILEALDGTETIWYSRDKGLFSYVDCSLRPRFPFLNGPTPETRIQLLDQTQDATVNQLFSDVTSDFNEIYFTQHQVVRFMQKYNEKRNPLWLTSANFLVKKGQEFFVVTIRDESNPGSLPSVTVDDIRYGVIRKANQTSRLIIPYRT